MTLRELCIEAITDKLDGLPVDPAPVLDALLAVLAEHADEWVVERGPAWRPISDLRISGLRPTQHISACDVYDLLTVLKPTTEEDA